MNQPLRVYLAVCATPEKSSPALPGWRENAACDRYAIHRLTDDPEEADLILFVDLHLCADWRLRGLQAHPLVRAHRDKVLVYNDRDQPWCVFPGLYCSMPAAFFDSRLQRACAYHRTPGQLDESPGSGSPPDLLFSFLGSRSHPLRREVLKLRHPRAVVEDTSSFVFYDRSDPAAYDRQKAGYEATLFRSKFVLCPRGAGTASFRLFETLAAGKVPVIISDEWVPPHGPDWAACSLRVRESDLARIPALLAAAEERWPQLAAAARATHETWFARTVLFHQMMESCSELLAMRAPTLRPRRGGRYWQLGLWNLKHTARSLPGKAFRSLRRCVTRRP